MRSPCGDVSDAHWRKENFRDTPLTLPSTSRSPRPARHDRRELLEFCISNLRDGRNVEESLAELVRYTGCHFGESADEWQERYDENKDYLYFSDCDGSRFLIDEEAKAAGVSTEEYRGWSSEEIDYRTESVPVGSF